MIGFTNMTFDESALTMQERKIFTPGVYTESVINTPVHGPFVTDTMGRPLPRKNGTPGTIMISAYEDTSTGSATGKKPLIFLAAVLGASYLL